jgi:hypothetical protein
MNCVKMILKMGRIVIPIRATTRKSQQQNRELMRTSRWLSGSARSGEAAGREFDSRPRIGAQSPLGFSQFVSQVLGFSRGVTMGLQRAHRLRGLMFRRS